MNRLRPLLSKKPKPNLPLLDERNNVILKHVEFGSDCGMWKGVPIAGKKVVDSVL
jgi:hypothetical protein